ncbi:MAG: hypothetical protein LYZ69_00380 [Nitrososphaerales archaeon]|nr:hypothetical protein [Nitrososphaerales archaeon]
MDLSELEVAAGRLLEEQKRLRSIDSELTMLKQELREMPRREVKDKSFYALIGLNYEEPGHSNREAELKKERESVLKSIREAEGTIKKGLTSQGLVIPLDPNPTVVGDMFTFRFRSQTTFPKTMEELGELLGLSSPIRIGPVMIYADKIVVTEVDQYFAKEKIVEAFDNIRKSVNLRLTQRR